tara:strand:- start:89 stop:283 length:195 start_codon:yes stop_codon:yes gene_type:complete
MVEDHPIVPYQMAQVLVVAVVLVVLERLLDLQVLETLESVVLVLPFPLLLVLCSLPCQHHGKML